MTRCELAADIAGIPVESLASFVRSYPVHRVHPPWTRAGTVDVADRYGSAIVVNRRCRAAGRA